MSYLCPTSFVKHSKTQYYPFLGPPHGDYFAHGSKIWGAGFSSQEHCENWSKMNDEEQDAHQEMLRKWKQNKNLTTEELRLEFEEKYPHLPVHWVQTQYIKG